jgi:hypothetical protein
MVGNMKAVLLGSGTLDAHREHLPAAIGATVGADMVREPRLAALRTNLELRQLDAVMLAAVALTPVGDSFLGECAHGMLLMLLDKV